MKKLADETGALVPAVDVPMMLKSTFETKSLWISPTLAGSVHRFLHNKKKVEIHLPQAQPPETVGTPSWDQVADLWCDGWRTDPKTHVEIPLRYAVRRVAVFVDLHQTWTVPLASLETPNPEHYSDAAYNQLGAAVTSGEPFAKDAFRLWLRTLRWKSLNAHIDQMTIEPTDLPARSVLIHAVTKQRFYSGISLNATIGTPIPPRAWKGAGKALENQQAPPLWLDFLFEGEHRVASSDLHGGMVCLAIACEVMIRRLVTRPTNRPFYPILKRMDISRIREHWKSIGPTNKRINAAFDTVKLNRLFDLRNGIMHRGEIHDLNKAECLKLAEMARAFIVAGTKVAERIARRTS